MYTIEIIWIQQKKYYTNILREEKQKKGNWIL